MNVICPDCHKIEQVPDFAGERPVFCSRCDTTFQAVSFKPPEELAKAPGVVVDQAAAKARRRAHEED